MKNEKSLSPVSKTLFYMNIMIFLMSIGEGLTAPAIPLYGDILGASYSQLGFLMTGYSLAYTVLTLTAGRLSDKTGRKNILLAGIVLSIIASTGYYFSTVPLSLLIFRTIEGMSRGILWPISEAIIADNSNLKDRDRAMGHFTAAYGAGATIGTLISGYIMEYINLQAVFPFYPLFGIIVFITSLLGISKTEESQQIINFKINDSNAREEVKKIWPLCFIGFAYSGFLFSIWGLLSMVAHGFNISSMGIGYIFALFWGARLFSFINSSKISKILGRKKSLVTGILFSAVSLGIFVTAGNNILLFLAALSGGIGTGITFPVLLTLVTDYISPSYTGFGTGLLEFTMGIGMIIQTALSGILGELRGIQSTYLFTFIVTLAAISVAILFVKDEKNSLKDKLNLS